MNKNIISYAKKIKYRVWIISFIVKNTDNTGLLNRKIVKRQFVGYTKKDALELAKNEFVTTLEDKIYFARAITITIKDIASNKIIAETAIFDGFTNKTIEQLQLEIKRTQDLIISLNKNY